ncbi:MULTISPECIES: hypothetical protein [Enterobacterales]|uniref:hypothetical protein n=1 Tax=Enterobacterales TaxID=91347 RepID=UPI002EDB2213
MILSMRILIIASLVFLTSCTVLSPKAEYIPENEQLPNATIGQPYFFKVSILGGRVFGGRDKKAGVVEPSDTGIAVRNCDLPASVIAPETVDPKDHNCVEVYGTPTQAGIVKIHLESGMYGSMIAPASYFSKDYKLNVLAN